MAKNESGRREFLGLLGLGGVTFASALWGCNGGESAAAAPARAASPAANDFFFLQLSDTHVGFKGPPNPGAATTLPQVVARIKKAPVQPDFIVFTGDLTHTTDDANERRERMKRFKDMVAPLPGRILYLPGEHDAAPDRGDAYREHFGEVPYAFDHKGIHFVALDNASAPSGAMGDAQLEWLEKDLARVPLTTPVVVFAHRPLFPLFPDWEWATSDGARAIEILNKRTNVTVFYGHIHQEHDATTGNVVHHASRSLVFPLPAPGAVPKRAPLPWDPAARDHGLGFREVTARGAELRLREDHVEDLVTAAAVSCDGARVTYAQDARPVMERACFSCHTGDGPAAEDHDFSKVDVAFAQRARIERAISAGAMPPKSRPPLDTAPRDTLLRWLSCGAK